MESIDLTKEIALYEEREKNMKDVLIQFAPDLPLIEMYPILKPLAEKAKNSEDRAIILKELFYLRDLDKGSQKDNNMLEEIVNILLKKDTLKDLLDKTGKPYTAPVILNIVETLNENFYQKNKSDLLHFSVPILLIESDQFRMDYMEKLLNDDSQLLWIDNIFTYLNRIDESFPDNIYKNIMKAMEYCYNQPVRFFGAMKEYFDNSFNEEVQTLLFVNNPYKKIPEEDKKTYVNYIINHLKKEDCSINNVLLPLSPFYIFEKIDPIIFSSIIDYAILNNNFKLIDGMIENCNDSLNDVEFKMSNEIKENMNILMSKKANYEKEQIQKSMNSNEVNHSKNKVRL